MSASDALQSFGAFETLCTLSVGAAVIGLTYLGMSAKAKPDSSQRRNPNLPQMQSKPVEGMPGARISAKIAGPDQLLRYMYEDAQTIYQALLRGCRRSKNGDFLGYRETKDGPYRWIKYQTVIDRAAQLGAGLLSLGLEPGQETRVAIFSQNRVEYLLTEFGCYTYSMVLVPLYDTLGLEAVQYIIGQAGIQLVVVDHDSKIRTLLKASDLALLKTVVCMQRPADDVRTEAEAKGLTLVTFADVEAAGGKNAPEPQPPQPDDTALICYTSGTTGLPKGVISTHGNYIASASSILKQMETHLSITNDDCHVSYLPLAHSYERMAQITVFQEGGRIGFFFGDIRNLTEDIKALKPTIFSTVPRLLNRLYDKVNATVQKSWVKRQLFGLAMWRKGKALDHGTLHGGTLWDKVVFKNVQEGLGGRLRFIATGSAPIAPNVMDFTRITTGAPVVEGYGQTECAAVCACNLLSENRTGNVGPPVACNIIRLVDIPEMNYRAENNQGEVCIKGHNVFQGYLAQPDKTEEALDADGWLHTGDVGEWTQDGCLRIIDRKKHIFKLAQGEYIAPEKIENIYIRSAAIAQMFVHGDSLKASLVGVGFVDPEAFPEWVKQLDKKGSLQQLCADPDVVKAVLEELIAIGKKAGLHSFEQVKRLHLEPELMTVENELLTPTLKAKRAQIKQRFQANIDALYEGID